MRRRRRLRLFGLLVIGTATTRVNRCAGISGGGAPRGNRCAALILGLSAVLALGGPALAAEPAALHLAVEVQRDGMVLAVGRVTDARGNPAPGVPVTFRVQTAFGWLQVAEIKTGRTGEAAVRLPQMPGGEVLAQAETGEQTLRASKRIGPRPPLAPRTRPGPEALSLLSPQPGFVSPYPPVQILFLAVILGGIWMTYGYLIWRLVKIRQASRDGDRADLPEVTGFPEVTGYRR